MIDFTAASGHVNVQAEQSTPADGPPASNAPTHTLSTGRTDTRPSVQYQARFADAIPEELRALRQWVIWRYQRTPDGKWTKVPFRARNPKVKASTTDNRTWGAFPEALAAFEAGRNLTGRDRIDGVGFVFSEDDPYVGVDLDNCLDETGVILPWAVPYVRSLKTYGEISPSGRGIKFIAWGKLPGKGRKKTAVGPDGGAVEMYGQARFFTITGNRLDGHPTTVEDLSAAVAALHDELFPPKEKVTPKAGPRPATAAAMPGDDALLAKALASKGDFAALWQGDTSKHDHDESRADLALCSHLGFWFGGDVGAIDRMFRLSGLMREKWDRDDYRERTISKAMEGRTEFYSPKAKAGASRNDTHNGSTAPDHEVAPNFRVFPPPAAAGTPEQLPEVASDTQGNEAERSEPEGRAAIIITTDEHLVIDDAVKALAKKLEVYKRAFSLVHVLRDESKKGPLRPSGTPTIRPIPPPKVRKFLSEVAAWFKLRKTRDGDNVPVPAHPPDWAVAAVVQQGEWSDVRYLSAVTETPVLKPDGSVLDTPGWDADTGLLYIPNGVFPEVPANPTQADAMASAERLLMPVCDFPFAVVERPDGTNDGGAAHRAAFLAALLTPFARWAIDGPTPLFVFDANTPGSGKTKLCDVIAILVSGRMMTRTGYSDHDEEMAKLLLAVALEGDRMVLFDNVPSGGAIGGPALDRALTASTVSGRILGQSKTSGVVELTTIFYATGNNLGLKGDALRRVVLNRLDSPVDRPEERDNFTIKGDLLKHVAANRSGLVADALTLLRGYVAAGRPKPTGLTPMDYPAWCEVVRHAIHWATGVDPCLTRGGMIAADTETNALANLVTGWKLLCEKRNAKSLTTAEAVKALESLAEDPDLAELRGTVMEWSKDGKMPPARVVGNRLKKFRGRVSGGYSLNFTPLNGNLSWFAKPVPGGGSGGSGGSSHSLRAEISSDNRQGTVGDAGEFTGSNGTQIPLTHLIHPGGAREGYRV